MTASVIGRFSAFDGSAETVRRASPLASPGEDPVRPTARTGRAGAESRHREPGITIDLRPDPPEEAPRRGVERGLKRAAGDRAGGPTTGRRRDDRARQSAPEPAWTYRANSDTPYRRRSSEQIYQAVETVDTPIPHRGGIFDRRI